MEETMKRIAALSLIFLLLVATSVFAADANIKKGNVFIGGGLDLSGNSLTLAYDTMNDAEGTATEMDMGLDAEAGYFVTDGLAIGAILGVDYLKQETDNDVIKYQYKGVQREWESNETATANAFRFGLEFGYFFDFGSIAVPYAMLQGGYLLNKTTVESEETSADGTSTTKDEDEFNSGGIFVGPKAGIALFFTEGLALNIGMDFHYVMGSGSGVEKTTVDGTESWDFEPDFDMTGIEYGFNVGFNVFF